MAEGAPEEEKRARRRRPVLRAEGAELRNARAARHRGQGGGALEREGGISNVDVPSGYLTIHPDAGDPSFRRFVVSIPNDRTASTCNKVVLICARLPSATHRNTGSRPMKVSFPLPIRTEMEGCSLHGAALNDARLLVPGSCKELLGNRLVVIRHKGSDQSVSLADPDTLLAALGEMPLVIGDPAHVPAGVYDREALLRRRECERPVFHRQRSGEIKGCAKILRRFIDGHPQFRRRVSPSSGLLLKSSVVLHSGTGIRK